MWVKSILLLPKKKSLSLPGFCQADVLITWQQLAPESEKLRWANNGHKLNEQSGLWEAPDGCLVLPCSPANPIFGFCIPSPALVLLRRTKLVHRGPRPPASGLFKHLQLSFVQLPAYMGYQNVLVIFKWFSHLGYLPQSPATTSLGKLHTS